MKPKAKLRMAVDLLMTAALLLLMGYERIGTLAHEWLGMGMFVLFLAHHILNLHWHKGLTRGKYPPYRVFQTLLAVLILISMLGSMVSGIILSRHLFSALPIPGGRAAARIVHLLCGYWGFVLMSLHLGLHWSIFGALVRRKLSVNERHKTPLRGLAVLIAVYGAWAFWKQHIPEYLFLRTQFVFFDFGQPLPLFLLEQLAMMGLFVFCGYYFGQFLRTREIKKE